MTLDGYGQARSGSHTGAVRGERRAPRRSGSSSSGTRPAGCTTTSARTRRRARELGRPEGHAARGRRTASRGARRGPPARLRGLRGRDPRRAVRCRHGRDLGPGHVRAVEEKKDGGLTVRLRGIRLEGLWTLVPARSRRRTAQLAPAAQGRRSRCPARMHRCWPPPPTSSRQGRAGRSSRSGTGIARWRGSWAATPRCGAGTTTTSAPRFPSVVRSARARRCAHACGRARRRGLCPRRDRTLGFGLLQQGAGTPRLRRLRRARADGEPLIDRPYRGAPRGPLERLLDTAVAGVLLSPSFDDGAALERAAP